MAMSVGLGPKELKAALEGVMPWLTPTGHASEALEKLDRPLLAWMKDPDLHMFDSAAHYAEYADQPGGLSQLERKIAKSPSRPEWEMERVRSPDEETDEAYDAAYEKACVTIGGRRLHPRDLDAYTTIAYELADLADQDATDLLQVHEPGLIRPESKDASTAGEATAVLPHLDNLVEPGEGERPAGFLPYRRCAGAAADDAAARRSGEGAQTADSTSPVPVAALTTAQG
ncbi:hypothetical protein [Streptomyces sp. NBC_00009]|uniref:hypothetical protein n=1 Tax=Streptomyces sp. NBC_00009 TaxID=2975620 RepID=UPI003254D274